MTARPGTETYAANLAFGHCGVPAIADMSVENVKGRAVRLYFPIVRDSILRRKWWSFAKGWTQPAADTQTSPGPLKTRYALPEDCLRVRYLTDADGQTYDEGCGDWDLEGSGAREGQSEQTFLVTNIAAPLIAYTRRIENVRLWDPVFLEGFGYELAAPVGRRLGKSTAFARDMQAAAAEIIETASAIDSKEQSRKKSAPTSSWLTARFPGRRRF